MQHELRGRTALVTGASSGLGVDFARELAARGADLILVARREQRMRAVADEIEAAHGVKTHVLPFDLGCRDAAESLGAELEARGLPVDILVNNAGFGLYGEFDAIDSRRERDMLELDIVTLAALTHRFVRDMKRRRWGRILLVSSIGAYQPSPTYAAYSAAKSFVLMYGRAIRQELKGTGVSCTVVSPGITRTEFLDVAGQSPSLYQRLTMMESPRVAARAIRALVAQRAEIVPGILNSVMAFSTRLIPRGIAAAIAQQLMLRM